MQEFIRLSNEFRFKFLTLIGMQTPSDHKSTDELSSQHLSDCRSRVIFHGIGFSPLTEITNQNKDIQVTIISLVRGNHYVNGNVLKGSCNRHLSYLSLLSPRTGLGHGTGISAYPKDEAPIVYQTCSSINPLNSGNKLQQFIGVGGICIVTESYIQVKTWNLHLSPSPHL